VVVRVVVAVVGAVEAVVDDADKKAVSVCVLFA
jgi:hypothetical protein